MSVEELSAYIHGRRSGRSLSNAQEFELTFYDPLDFDAFEEGSFQFKILEDLGESMDMITNDEGIEELTPVHKYRIEII